MRLHHMLPFAAAVSLVTAPYAAAQTGSADPTGHWEAVADIQGQPRRFALDLSKDPSGRLIGTTDNRAEHIVGLPLLRIDVQGRSVTFGARTDQMMTAEIDGDGRHMTGTATMSGYAIPFKAEKTGEARVAVRPRSAGVANTLAGTWVAAARANGKSERLELSLENQPDGTALATLVFPDEGGLEFPSIVRQSASAVTVDSTVMDVSFAGEFSEQHHELVGTFRTATGKVPLTFRRPGTDGNPRSTADVLIERWEAAVGGLPRVAAMKAVYREAVIEVAGVSGSIKAWHTAEGWYRKEEQIGSYSILETFDGTNGTVQRDAAPPRAVAGEDLRRVKSQPFANSNAMFFAFFPGRRHGTVEAAGDDTLVLKPEGGSEWRITFDPQTGLPKTQTHQEGNRTITVTFTAWETVDGITFEKELHRSAGDPRLEAIVRFAKTTINPTIDPSLFRGGATAVSR